MKNGYKHQLLDTECGRLVVLLFGIHHGIDVPHFCMGVGRQVVVDQNAYADGAERR